MGSSTISAEQVRHVAKLARLSPDEAEVADLTASLGAILEYVSQLDEIDTSGVEPMLHPSGLPLSLREDVVVPGLSTEDALAAAPRAHDGGFSVPKVIEEDG